MTKVLASVSAYCTTIRTLNLAQKTSGAVQRSLLTELPEIVVATPAGARLHSESSSLDLSTLSGLVIDEADLVLSYGYEDDVQVLADAIPNQVQSILVSATLGSEVEELRNRFCQDLVLVELDEEGEESNPISQFVVKYGQTHSYGMISDRVQVRRGREVLVNLRDSQAEIDQGQMHYIRGRY